MMNAEVGKKAKGERQKVKGKRQKVKGKNWVARLFGVFNVGLVALIGVLLGKAELFEGLSSEDSLHKSGAIDLDKEGQWSICAFYGFS